MFTDTVGHSAATHSDEAGALERLREQERLLRPLFRKFQGHEIKSTGDGFLVEFDSALRAAQCAIEVQRRMHERNSRPGAVRMDLRIGIHLGDIEQRQHDIFGDAVNIASRVEPLADPGGVCVSQQVYDQVSNKLGAPLESLGLRRLKGFASPLPVYRVTLPWATSPVKGLTSERHRLAVLPLANISPDPKDEYFADGLTEELISVLSGIKELRVIARTSVNQYKSTAKPLSQIGADLDVRSVIEGSVRKSGNQLRITIQLIDVASQEDIWSASYDRELNDVFAVQTEIAQKTAEALRLGLTGPAAWVGRKRPTADIAAYNLYLKGIHAARQSTIEGYLRAAEFFEEAIRRDPDFSLACSYLANVYILLAGDRRPAREMFPRARELTMRALRLDPDSSDAHTALGNLLLQSEQDWERAEVEFLRAIALNPSDEDGHFWFAMLLRVSNRFDESIRELQTVMELDPLWWLPKDWLLLTYLLSGRLEDALAFADDVVSQEPEHAYGHIARGLVFVQTGRLEEARRELKLATHLVWPSDRLGRALLAAQVGELHEVRELLAEFTDPSKTKYISPATVAGLYALLGDKAHAYEWLDRDVAEGERTLWAEFQFPQFDSIRGEPRFRAILTQLHLPVKRSSSLRPKA